MKKPRLKKRVTGLGGIFLRVKNPKEFALWYRKHLGLDVNDQWFGCAFEWRDAKNPKKKGTTVWGAFPADTDYFGSRKQPAMLNYRVANLKRVLADLKKEGVWVDPHTEESEYGKFGWIKDGEGNRIELWQPPRGK
jgi:catechol 2,3-dioxygenase-like lactoylglutathione lyase family enzyme